MWSDWITVNSQQLVPLITRLFCYVFNWGVYWTRKLFPSPGNLPDPGFKPRSAIQETQIQSLGQEDLLEKRMATHSSILAWRISWTEEPGGLQFIALQRVGHDWAANTCLLAIQEFIQALLEIVYSSKLQNFRLSSPTVYRRIVVFQTSKWVI